MKFTFPIHNIEKRFQYGNGWRTERSLSMSTTVRMPVSVECVDNVCAEVESVYGRIAAKAYAYFLDSGCINGHDVDDWLRAEQELIFKPAVQLHRQNSHVIVNVDLPGINLGDLNIKVSSQQMLVISVPFDVRQIFCIVRFPEPVDPAGVEATFQDGELRIVAPFAAEVSVRSLGTVA